MKVVVALKDFRRSDTKEHVSRDDVFEAPAGYAGELIQNGLVRETRVAPIPEVKAHAAGVPSSASQAALASQKQTSKKQGNGRRRTRRTAASS